MSKTKTDAMNAHLRRFLASLLIVLLAIPFPTQAGMVATEEALDVQRARIAAIMDRADVQPRLQAYGVSAAEAKARVGALSDAEAMELAARIDSLLTGGDAGVAVFIVVLLILVFVGYLRAQGHTL